MSDYADITLPKRPLYSRRSNGYITVFDPNTGRKLRFYPEGAEEPGYGLTPEVVDICVTHYCDIGCPKCYMDSTTSGKHANIIDIHQIARLLYNAQVFEVALGGGEPTQMPRFAEVLNVFHVQGINVNFTTRSLDWIRDGRYIQYMQAASAFAYSVSNVNDIEKLYHAINETGHAWDFDGRVNLHIIMGLTTEGNLLRMMAAAKKRRFNVTLLGYKHSGRGGHVVPVPYEDWLVDNIAAMNEIADDGLLLGIDTVLSEQIAERLYEVGIPREQIDAGEGAFSGYIDAVNMKLLPASYVPMEFAVDLNWRSDEQKHAYGFSETNEAKAQVNSIFEQMRKQARAWRATL